MKPPARLPHHAALAAAVLWAATAGCPASAQEAQDPRRLQIEVDRLTEACQDARLALAKAQATLAGKDGELETGRKRLAELKAQLESLPPQARAKPPGEAGPALHGFASEVNPYVVVIEGDEGSGTGFLCTTEGQVWVYTAAHVLSGNSKITVRDSHGNRYQEFEFIECAEGVDLVRLKPRQQDLKGLELTSQAEAPVVGDTIVAIGNSLGTGSLSAEGGKVTGIEEDMWQVDAEIIPGNSGGPVLDFKTKKVTGIVTHLIIERPEGASAVQEKAKVKRFAARLDKTWKWRRMDITRFVKEWKYLEQMRTDSAATWASSYIMYVKSGGDRDKDAYQVAQSIVRGAADHASVQRMNNWVKQLDTMNPGERPSLMKRGNEIIEQMYRALRLSGSEPTLDHFSWYHRQDYEDQRSWRRKMTKE